jgi:hypothetical protein
MLPMSKEDVDFEVQAALAWHDDNVLATVATLLGDIRHLRQQLALTENSHELRDGTWVEAKLRRRSTGKLTCLFS